MAEAMLKYQSLNCPLCLDLLTCPATIPCGHHFCMKCINGHWDQEEQKGVYSCHLCKHTFTPRPVLYENPRIREKVDARKQIQPVSNYSCNTRNQDVECNICIEEKLKAVKSCLECLMSYCETHFELHNIMNPGRKHHMIDATKELQERICSSHRRPLEIFCRTDQRPVCYGCMMEEHKSHDTVPAAEERKERQKKLVETKEQIQQKLQRREQDLEELMKAVKTPKSSAQTAVEDSEKIFTEIMHSIRKKQSDFKKQIRTQEKSEVSRADGVLKQLEQEIAELKRRDAELEQLSHTDDHIHFLKHVPSQNDWSLSKDLPSVTFNQSFPLEILKDDLSALQLKLEEALDDFLKQEAVKISETVAKFEDNLIPEPKTRDKFSQYFCHFTLDPNTANKHLRLSQGNRRVEYSREIQSYPDHPERFNMWCQVLCKEGVSGRCYWEIEWCGEIDVVVSYKGISRKGGEANSRFGWNDQSWRIHCSPSRTSFKHSNKETRIPLVRSSRIGVFVNHTAGSIAFYSISDTKMTLLHRVQTTFTDTLYPGFWVCEGSSVNILRDMEEMYILPDM